MLTITRDQFAEFDQAVAAHFEAEMRQHCWDFSPALCKTLGSDGVAKFVRHSIERARYYGFTLRGPIRLFIEMSLLRGSFFDTDPQYRPFGEALRQGGTEMERAEKLHALSLDYTANVAGAEGENVMAALAALVEFTEAPKPDAFPTEFDAKLETFKKIFPHKVEHMGRLNFGRLVHRSQGVTMRLNAQERWSDWVIMSLMLAFGHGCISDPLYPWISKTLYQTGPASGDARITQVERKARIWLDAVLKREEEGAL